MIALGPVRIFSFDVNDVTTGVNFDGGQLGGILDTCARVLQGFGATLGGIFVGGGMVRVSSLNGSGYPVKA